jgi:hypothetical protein
MKKIILILILGTLLFSGCKNFLDTPAPEISDAVYFSNTQAALNALAGAYDPMGWYNYLQVDEWGIGDVASDDAEKGGENEADQADMYAIAHFKATPQNGILEDRWKTPYIGINRANKLIAGLTDNKNISKDICDRIIGEAKFIRAFFYFSLVKDFGGVPIVTKVLSPSEYDMPRNSVKEVYAQIEKDLKDAIKVLPKKSQLKASEIGRATWGAASALLVKAYVFEASIFNDNNKWKQAYDLATKIVNSGEYNLEPNYSDIFKLSHDNGVESVFDIQFGNFGTGEWGDDQEGTVTCIFQRSREYEDGWGFDCPTQNLYDEFEPGDKRLKATIISDGDTLWKGTPDQVIITTKYPQNPTGYHNRKYQLPQSQWGAMSEDPLNWRYIRFAEVLLWQAEAAAHIGADWKTPLNRVRARAGLAPTTETNALKAVYHEQRVELAMEGHRYWDLIRTGRGYLMKGYTDNKKYLPIPQVEINLNPNLKQNPY